MTQTQFQRSRIFFLIEKTLYIYIYNEVHQIKQGNEMHVLVSCDLSYERSIDEPTNSSFRPMRCVEKLQDIMK